MVHWRLRAGCLAAVLLCALAQVAKAETLTLATGEWPPYTSTGLKHGGFATRIVREAFESEGLEVKVVYYPWARAVALAGQPDSGIDGVYPISHSSERETLFYFSRPVATGTNAFFHLRSRPFTWQSLADLSGVTIGANVGYSYGDAFQAAERKKALRVERVGDPATNFRKLLAGRLDLVLMNVDEAKYTLAMQFPADAWKVDFHPRVVVAQDDFLAVGRRHPRARELIETFNRGLTRLQEEGKLERYLMESRRGDYLPVAPPFGAAP
ncbi:substrate-binding periplasmic protein [Chitinimonas sp.]|uniref:substrate-binding periplasmic protein n=1 Tax=Chitinimonas sp. TaxID=1934313 RepID=UPI002F95E16A